MSDPPRLLDGASAIEERLLSSALDEPPPDGLLERTLDVVTAATAASGALSAGSAANGANAAGAKAAGGWVASVIGAGAIAGLVTLGAYLATTGESEGYREPIASSASVSMPALPPTLSPASPPPRATAAESAPLMAAPSAAVTAATSARPSMLALEISLLDETSAALRAGDRVRARALLDRHAREITRPQLGREAALLRVEAEAAPDAGDDESEIIPGASGDKPDRKGNQ